jgi:pimeloyl-ACP methyl ester carboxylesterase
MTPDLRGYGESDKPTAVQEYDIHHLAGDIVGLLDALELERAVLVGHDWGAIVVWSVAVMYPERVECVVSLNVPYRGRCVGFPQGRLERSPVLLPQHRSQLGDHQAPR